MLLNIKEELFLIGSVCKNYIQKESHAKLYTVWFEIIYTIIYICFEPFSFLLFEVLSLQLKENIYNTYM